MEGSLLGIFEEAEYTQRTIQLQHGDKLLLYSDGAEPFISNSNGADHSNFSEQFREITGRPIAEMMDKFSVLVQKKETTPSVTDDITAVGFEIL